MINIECCGINTACDDDGTCCVVDQVEEELGTGTNGDCTTNSDCCNSTSTCQINVATNNQVFQFCGCFPLGIEDLLILLSVL